MSSINPFNFESEKDSVKCLALAVRFMRQTREANAGFSGWVIREARKFNSHAGDPSLGAVNADLFMQHMQKLINELITKQQELCGFTLNPDDIKALKLEGNSPLANACKRVANAMRFGGDLDSDECATVSKCAKFAADARKTQEGKDLAEKRRKGAELKAEGEGLEPNTDAFNKRVAELLNIKLEAIPAAGTTSEMSATFTPVDDEVGAILREIEAEARKVAELYGVQDALQQLTVYKDKLHNRAAARLAQKIGAINDSAPSTEAA